MTDVLRIANCSGFYGDRLSAAREMVEDGPIDVLTGDYLAELTLMILLKDRLRDPTLGYARTFLTQLEEVAATCKRRGIRIVVNAGGLNPAGCAEAARALYRRLGVDAVVAHIEGDDLLPKLADLQAQGEPLAHMDKGTPLAALDAPVLSANAYLGGWGIATALARGADLVVCPRVTDAALTLGPAAWKFGWARDDWDRLAAAVVAGHVIECGAQTTGGNYSFFREVPGLERPGFPIAEMRADGTFIVTKHPGTGGLVSVGTVTAQLLYEIAGPRYPNPDVTARFDTIELVQEGPDRVLVRGVRGEPPPPTTKVCLNYFGGWKNGMTFVLTGLDVEEKARLAERTIWTLVGGREQFAETRVSLVRADHPNPATNEEAYAYLTITVKDRDPKKVGRAFSGKVVEMALSSYPGFFMTTAPTSEAQVGVYWPALVPSTAVEERVVIGEESIPIAPAPIPPAFAPPPGARAPAGPVPGGPVRDVPLGALCGARSGDKGGNANVGLWVRTPEAYRWLAAYLTVDRFRALVPEARDLVVERFELPNLLAVNFVVHGLLGEGVAASLRSDPQAKSLGEYVRAKVVPIPAALLDG
ncbi:MAG TPA: acyclic terpene utilization AtuA family protein [Candidatus Binatia bacterium]|nr:acyclic terpene utilization AtuA family protein [Candidatus Binatia bacterium]